MSDTEQFQIAPGTSAMEASGDVLSAAVLSKSTVRAEFNGTPMVAYPSDESPQAVFLRWHYERIIIQIRNGVLRPEDVVLS